MSFEFGFKVKIEIMKTLRFQIKLRSLERLLQEHQHLPS